MKPIFVLYHANCYDGFGSAWAAWKALNDTAKYLPVKYGDPPPNLPNDAVVFILDFSYSKQILLDLKQQVAELTLIDHHKTAQEDLAGLDFAIFDMSKSGAMLAWQFWHPNIAIPDLIAYIQDRDLWQFELPKSQEVFAALSSYSMDFQVWDKLDLNLLMQEGEPIFRFLKQSVKNICDQSTFQDLGGYVVPVVNATSFFSDISYELCCRYPESPFAAYYFDRADGMRQWGLRSTNKFDVGAIAKKYGGGGHRDAAGFVEAKPE